MRLSAAFLTALLLPLGSARSGLAGSTLLTTSRDKQGAPADEYKTKLAALSKSAAAKHYSIADYLAGAQMYQWAREQLYKVIEYDPDHENARKKLGFKKGDEGKWESDPAIKQEFGNKKKGEDAERIRKAYVDRMDSAGRDLSRLWGDLALFCKKSNLAADAATAFQKALEYDPANATARKELGYEKDAKGIWSSKFERQLRKEMKEGLSKAPAGAAANEETEIEKKLGIKNKKRESGHFFIESPHLTEAQLGTLLQHAEHTYAIFHKLFDQTDLLGTQKGRYVALKDKAQHEKYIDTCYRSTDAARIDLAKKSQGSGFEVYQGTLPEEFLHDWIVHETVELLLSAWVGGHYVWLTEGMALHFTRLMKESAMVHCVDLAGTSPKNKGKSYTDPKDWPVVCRVWVREGKDPDLTATLKCVNHAELDGAECIKGWSIVEFLLAEHRPKFLEFMKALAEAKGEKEGQEIEAIFKRVWSWTISDLDYKWKQYVKVSY